MSDISYIGYPFPVLSGEKQDRGASRRGRCGNMDPRKLRRLQIAVGALPCVISRDSPPYSSATRGTYGQLLTDSFSVRLPWRMM